MNILTILAERHRLPPTRSGGGRTFERPGGGSASKLHCVRPSPSLWLNLSRCVGEMKHRMLGKPDTATWWRSLKSFNLFRSASRRDYQMRAESWIPKLLTSSATLLLGLLLGCGPQDTKPKASHFEHDHNVASHWPIDLADAAAKIRERLVWIETGEEPGYHPQEDSEHKHGHDDHHHDHVHDPEAEIFDLVSWVPEVAADTNLSEADWLPLYHASESLMTNLHAAKNDLSRDDRSQIESLCQLIDEAIPKIPEHLVSLKVTSP